MTEKDPKKKHNTMDKVVFGLLVGGAIGSVLGLTVAPKKGEKIRKDIEGVAQKGKKLVDEHEDAVGMVMNKSKGVLGLAKRLLAKKKKAEDKPEILKWLDEMEKIPTEDRLEK